MKKQRRTYNVERRTVKTGSMQPAVIRTTNPVLLLGATR